MSARSTAFASRATEEWKETADSLSSNTLFLVARIGPTVFGIKDENDETYRVTLGNPHKCTCGSASNTCVHKLFCLIKVLKVPVVHSLCYQSSLTDKEMDQVLDGLHTQQTRRRPARVPKPSSASGDEAVAVLRQPLLDDQEETCPICQDEMLPTCQALTWCRAGCGNNIHAKCMLKFCQYKISNKQDASCPFCRASWDMELLRLDCKGKASLKHSYSPVHCCSCKCLQRGAFYRCVECSQLGMGNPSVPGKPMDFCADCFAHTSAHSNHHFVAADVGAEISHGMDWAPAKNPSLRGVVTNPTLLNELQSRELGVGDYDLLLQLDDGGPAQSLPDLCVESLPPFRRPRVVKGKRRCWCTPPASPSLGNDSPGNVGTSPGGAVEMSPNRVTGTGSSAGAGGEGGAMRILPCRHVAHDRCLREAVTQMTAEDAGRVVDCRCEHAGCGARVMVGLSRRRRRRAPDQGKEGEKSVVGPTGAGVSGTGGMGGADAQRDGMPGVVGASCFGGGGLVGSLARGSTLRRGGAQGIESGDGGAAFGRSSGTGAGAGLSSSQSVAARTAAFSTENMEFSLTGGGLETQRTIAGRGEGGLITGLTSRGESGGTSRTGRTGDSSSTGGSGTGFKCEAGTSSLRVGSNAPAPTLARGSAISSSSANPTPRSQSTAAMSVPLAMAAGQEEALGFSLAVEGVAGGGGGRGVSGYALPGSGRRMGLHRPPAGRKVRLRALGGAGSTDGAMGAGVGLGMGLDGVGLGGEDFGSLAMRRSGTSPFLAATQLGTGVGGDVGVGRQARRRHSLTEVTNSPLSAGAVGGGGTRAKENVQQILVNSLRQGRDRAHVRGQDLGMGSMMMGVGVGAVGAGYGQGQGQGRLIRGFAGSRRNPQPRLAALDFSSVRSVEFADTADQGGMSDYTDGS
ncbi:hypothetical protein B484DRAFT_422864 [Ochromonadaceae sp. CCMP2298]|nr:hypothetical protein B484DRAFT_422864 [Ochromonadaceae sp. CCMP2298]